MKIQIQVSTKSNLFCFRLYYRKVSTNMSNFYTVETDVTSVQLKGE